MTNLKAEEITTLGAELKRLGLDDRYRDEYQTDLETLVIRTKTVLAFNKTRDGEHAGKLFVHAGGGVELYSWVQVGGSSNYKFALAVGFAIVVCTDDHGDTFLKLVHTA